MKTKLTILALLCAGLTQASDRQRQRPAQGLKPHVEWSAYGLNNYWHQKPVEDGGVLTFVFPQAAHGNYVSVFSESSTAESDLRGQSVWMVFDMAVDGGIPVFNYGWENTPVNDSPNPASMRFFVSDLASPLNLDTENRHPEHYWFYDAGIGLVNVLDFIQENSYEASFDDFANWTDGLGHSATDPIYRTSFLNCISHTRQKGLAFGGGRFFDVGVGTSSVEGQAEVTFRLLTFQTFTPHSKR